MPSLASQVLGLNACAVVPAGAAAFTRQRGFAGLVHNGAGDVTLTLKNGLDFANGAGYALVQIHAAAAAGPTTVQYVDATHIRVLTTNAAGAATDEAFSIEVKEIGPN